MKLVLIHSDGQTYGALSKTISPALVPLLNKPIAQHQIELGYAGGFRDVALIASDGITNVNRHFGDGERFNVALDILLGSLSGDEIESLLKHRALFDAPFFATGGLRLARVDTETLAYDHEASGKAVSLFCDSESGIPIGAFLNPEARKLLVGRAGPLLSTLEDMHATGSTDIEIIERDFKAAITSGISGLLELNQALLRNPSVIEHNPYFEKDVGVFIGRGASISPSARITAPVLIGHHSQVMSGAEVGPFAVIGDNTIISRKAKIHHATIFANSYIGEMTRVVRAIVSENRLFSPEHDAKVVVTDPFLLGRVSENLLGEALAAAVNRGLAAGLFLAFSPIGLATALSASRKYKRPFKGQTVLGAGQVETLGDLDYLPRFNLLRFPVDDMPVPWWPSLINVMKGNMRLIGPRPIACDKPQMLLDADWQLKRFATPPGITGPSQFSDDEYENCIAENLYTEKKSLKLDAKIFLARLARPIIGRRVARRFIGL